VQTSCSALAIVLEVHTLAMRATGHGSSSYVPPWTAERFAWSCTLPPVAIVVGLQSDGLAVRTADFQRGVESIVWSIDSTENCRAV
jgi:hypothetical protein